MKTQLRYSYLLAFIFFAGISRTAAQSTSRIDSLKHALQLAVSDTSRTNLLNLIAKEFLYSDSAQCAVYASQALDLSDKSNDWKNKVKAINILGNLSWTHADYDRALKYYLEALAIYEKQSDKTGIADEYINIGNVYYSLNNPTRSLEYYSMAATIYHAEGKETDEAGVLNNIGAVYNLTGENQKALDTYFRTIKMLGIKKNNPILLNTLNNIGNTYHYLKQNDKAIEYLNQSLKISERIGDKKGIALAYDNIASLSGDLNDPDQTIMYASKGLEYAIESGAIEQERNAYNYLSSSYALKNDFKKAYEYQLLYLKAAQTILSAEKNRAVHELEAKYEADKKEKEIALLNQREKTSRIILYSVSGGLLLIIILAILMLTRYRLKQKVTVELQKQKSIMAQKNEELERLSIVASETENVILILDPDGKLEWVNSSFERLNAITKDDLIQLKGETIYEISNNPDIRNIIRESIRQRKPVTYESLNITHDGRSIWESSTLTPIFNKDGNLRKLIIIDTDVTARKNAESIIQQKNKDITDSINYASKIQQAFLPENGEFKNHFPDSFVLFKPKDIVSGDFYWLTSKNENIYFSAADCTGHGVPGGFMSMLGTSLLNEIINEKNISEPADILDLLRIKIIHALKQKGEPGESKDGMDMSLCLINKDRNQLTMAAANNPVWIVRNNNFIELKADKQPVGLSGVEDVQFTQQTIPLEKHDCIYAFTDGYADQFGGPKGKKFKYKQLQEILMANNNRSMEEQKNILDQTIEQWKGELEQIDDILIIGIRI